MRLFLVSSAALSLSLVSGVAIAAPPTTVFDVGSFQSARLAPGADATAIEQAARVVLAERVPAANGLAFVSSPATFLRDGRRIAKLRQTHAGLPVIDRSATVTFDAKGVAHIIAAKIANELPADVTPAVDAATAAATANRYANAVANANTAQLVIWPSDGRERLAWRFYTPSRGLPHAPITVVDAKTGVVLAHYNAARSVHQANVYPSNPIKSPTLTTVTLPLPEGATTLADEFVSAHNCIDTNELTPHPVSNENFHVCKLQQTAIADAVTLDFSAQPEADDKPGDPFAELHLYHHTRVAYDYFRGFDPAFKVQDAPVDTVANYMIIGALEEAADPNASLVPYSNAFFSPGIGLEIYGVTGATMFFGQGTRRDFAYDADVIYHEFGHAVVSRTVDFVGTAHHDKFGITLSPSAMNEGIADYFSAIISGDAEIGEYAAGEDEAEANAIRSLTHPDSCPSAIGGEEHVDATLFSGGLWDVRSKLAADAQSNFDLSVFGALQAAPSGDLGYEDFANLIIEQVKMSPALGTQVATQLADAFANRGVLPECARILEYTGVPMTGPAPAPGYTNTWYSIGTGQANLGDSNLGYAPGVMQVHVPLPENTDLLTVTFLGGGPEGRFAPHVLLRLGDDPIEFTLAPLATPADVRKVAPTRSVEQYEYGWRVYTAKIEGIAGAKSAHVMIVNTNEFLGAYTNVEFTMTQSAGRGGNGTTAATEGCGCTVPGSSSAPLGLSLISLATVAGLWGRRRRT